MMAPLDCSLRLPLTLFYIPPIINGKSSYIYIYICMYLCTTIIQLIVYVCDRTWSHRTARVFCFHVQIAPAFKQVCKLSSYAFSIHSNSPLLSLSFFEKELCMTDRTRCVFIDSSKRPDLACVILRQPYILMAKARQIAASHFLTMYDN